MGQVLVRNLDDRVIESLRTKAELKGCSLEQFEVRRAIFEFERDAPRSIYMDRIARWFEASQGLAPQLRDQRVAVGGALNDYGDRFIESAQEGCARLWRHAKPS